MSQMRSSDLETKLSAFKNFYEDYKNHLPNSLGLQTARIKGLGKSFEDFSSGVYAEISKVKVVRQAGTESYRLVSQGFLSIFRGRANIVDCSFDVDDKGDAYTRAIHEDTVYLFIYKGKELKGYIGLMIAQDKDKNKVLTVDTINSPSLDGEELLGNLFRALDDLAARLGCIGIALPKDIGPSFNFENKNTIPKMAAYKYAKPISVTPLHPEGWGYFTSMFGKDEYNSIEGGRFVLLNLDRALSRGPASSQAQAASEVRLASSPAETPSVVNQQNIEEYPAALSLDASSPIEDISEQFYLINTIIENYTGRIETRIKTRAESVESSVEIFKKGNAPPSIIESHIKTMEKRQGIDNLRTKLDKRKENIRKLQSQRIGIGVAGFIGALKTVEGGAVIKLADQQKRAMEAIGRVLEGSPRANNYNPNNILFVPESSWLMDLFDFPPAAAAVVFQVSDGAENATIILIKDGDVDYFTLIHYILHEIIHMDFRMGDKGPFRLTGDRQDEGNIFSVINEARIERETVKLLLEICRSNPDIMEGILFHWATSEEQEAEKDKVALLSKIVHRKAAYPYERMLLDTIYVFLKDYSGDLDAVDDFLRTGNSGRLKAAFGQSWDMMLKMTNSEVFRFSPHFHTFIVLAIKSSIESAAILKEPLLPRLELSFRVAGLYNETLSSEVDEESLSDTKPDAATRAGRELRNNFLFLLNESLKQNNIDIEKTVEEIKVRMGASSPVGGAPAPGKIDNSINSSSILVQKELGGIDFTSMPIVTQAISNLGVSFSPLRGQSLQAINLDEEFLQIQNLVKAGIAPSSERIKEYVQAWCMQDEANTNLRGFSSPATSNLGGFKGHDQIIICISDILRQEEERACETDPVLRDLLVVLEAGQSPAQLNKVFLSKAQ